MGLTAVQRDAKAMLEGWNMSPPSEASTAYIEWQNAIERRDKCIGAIETLLHYELFNEEKAVEIGKVLETDVRERREVFAKLKSEAKG